MKPSDNCLTNQADHRSDVYSLGCTLFFLLTGRAPFVENSVIRTVMAHQQQPIPSLTDMRGDVTPALDQVFRRMMDKQPGDRFVIRYYDSREPGDADAETARPNVSAEAGRCGRCRNTNRLLPDSDHGRRSPAGITFRCSRD